MTRLLRFIATLVLLFSPLLAQAAPATFKLAVIFPETGIAAEGVRPAKPAMELAVRQINERAGNPWRIELRFYDNKSTPGGSMQAARSAIADGAQAVIAPPWSSQTIPILPLLEEKQIPTFLYSATHPSLTAGRNYVFRLCFSDESQGRIIAEFMREQGFKSAFSVYEQSDYSITLRDNFARHFESLGGKNLQTIPLDMVDSLAEADVAALRQIDQGVAIFLPMMTNNAREAALALRRQLPRVPIVIGDGFGQSFLRNGGERLNRIYATQTASEDSLEKTPRAQALVDALRQSFKQQDDFNVVGHAALAYDAIQVLAGALARTPGKIDGKQLADTLRSIQVEGVTGAIGFDQRGERKQSQAVILDVNNGAIRHYRTVRIGQGESGQTPERGASRKPLEQAPSLNTVSTEAATARKIALVIGINNYVHYDRLKTAENDAREIAGLLEHGYGFEVRSLLGNQATKDQISRAINRLRRETTASDMVLIYYAGHGHFDKTTDRAYWLPVDAEQDDQTRWIMAEEITAQLKAAEARHVAIVSDSCYSGALARSIDQRTQRQERDTFIGNIWKRKSRMLLSSGSNEPVSDGGKNNHSVFAYYLLQALKAPQYEMFTLSELFQAIVQPVGGNAQQRPLLQAIRNSGDEGGEFVFVRKGGGEKK